jgi:hypothetical protein
VEGFVIAIVGAKAEEPPWPKPGDTLGDQLRRLDGCGSISRSPTPLSPNDKLRHPLKWQGNPFEAITVTDSTYGLGDRRGRRRRWTAVDTTMLQLVRLVMDEEWNAKQAGAILSELVGEEEAVLAQLGARVRRAHYDRSSTISERAVATLETLECP